MYHMHVITTVHVHVIECKLNMHVTSASFHIGYIQFTCTCTFYYYKVCAHSTYMFV